MRNDLNNLCIHILLKLAFNMTFFCKTKFAEKVITKGKAHLYSNVLFCALLYVFPPKSIHAILKFKKDELHI